MDGPEMLRDEPRMLRLIRGAMPGKTDAEGPYLARSAYGHGGDETRVHPATQQHTHWNVCDELPAHRILQQRFQFIQKSDVISTAAVGNGIIQLRQLPIAPRFRITRVELEHHGVSGRQ